MDLKDSQVVQALLDSLQSSSAWHDAISNTKSPEPKTSLKPQGTGTVGDAQPVASSSTSVASLLAQLQSNPPVDPAHSTNSEPRPPPPRTSDRRFLSYQQSLPILAELPRENPNFNDAVTSLKQKQDALERQLWAEREAIHDKYRHKVAAAKTKANIIGAGMTKHEGDMIMNGYRKELATFDDERAAAAWDALVQKQQETLQALGIPAMFVTSWQAEQEVQRKVMRAVEGMLD